MTSADDPPERRLPHGRRATSSRSSTSCRRPASRSRCARSSARSRSASTPRAGSSSTMLELVARGARVRASTRTCRCMFVTEDTTRAQPEHVRALYTTAIDAGAKRICVCDTCGHATPDGVRRLVRFVKRARRRARRRRRHRLARPPRPRPRPRSTRSPRSRPARRACTRPRSASASARATPRWTSCSSTCGCSGWIDSDLSALGDYVRARERGPRRPDPANYPVVRPRRVRDRHRRARRRRDQGLQEGRRLARRPRLLAACPPTRSASSR